jgi:hypothetical protein
VAAYWSQLKARVQVSGKTLHEFTATVRQLAHCAFVGLPVAFIQTEAANSFIDVWDWEVKQHLLTGGGRILNEALNQALKLEAAKAAAGPPARLREMTGVPARANQPSERGRDKQPVPWQCGSTSHPPRDCRRGPCEERNQNFGKQVNSSEKRGPLATPP